MDNNAQSKTVTVKVDSGSQRHLLNGLTDLPIPVFNTPGGVQVHHTLGLGAEHSPLQVVAIDPIGKTVEVAGLDDGKDILFIYAATTEQLRGTVVEGLVPVFDSNVDRSVTPVSVTLPITVTGKVDLEALEVIMHSVKWMGEKSIDLVNMAVSGVVDPEVAKLLSLKPCKFNIINASNHRAISLVGDDVEFAGKYDEVTDIYIEASPYDVKFGEDVDITTSNYILESFKKHDYVSSITIATTVGDDPVSHYLVTIYDNDKRATIRYVVSRGREKEVVKIVPNPAMLPSHIRRYI